VAANAAIQVCGCGSSPVYAYLGSSSPQEFRTNQVVLLAVLALVIFQVRRGICSRAWATFQALSTGPDSGCRLRSSSYWRSASWISTPCRPPCLAWRPTVCWAVAAPGVLARRAASNSALIGALPFGEHMDTFVGYPLRITPPG
jgi:hypothetical protein